MLISLKRIFSHGHMSADMKKSWFLAMPFIIMDVFIRILASSTNYIRPTMIIPTIVFSAIWIITIVSVARCLSPLWGKIFYGTCFALFFSFFFTHCVYFLYTGFFFRLRLTESADEGSAYIWDTIKNTNPLIFIFCVLLVGLTVYVLIKFPKREKKSDFKKLFKSLAVFGLVLLVNPLLLGRANSSLEWDTWRNPRNVYLNFNDSNKCMKICGLYQYSLRDFYITFFKSEEPDNPDELMFLGDIYNEDKPHAQNEYTGIFKGKNVIFLQLEGIDSWMFTKEDMPNAYSLLENSVNFTNHYSYYNGGGSTFNSELAVATGFLTPVSYSKNPYTFSTNLFNHSLPNVLKAEGYSSNAFHMNTGEYYSRELNYINWGYDAYYSLMDDEGRSDAKAQLDTELILNESFYKKMFCGNQPFMNYIITYTPHTPFTLSSPMGKALAEKICGEGKVPSLSEEKVARLFATETDNMIGLLIKALMDNNLYDNTVIVAFSDHYLYTLNDKSILDRYKRTDNNLVNHTPFFIWSSNAEKINVDKVNSQLDILPTVLNMLGIEYDENHYIGNDIMDKGFSGYAFFSDYSWYDGNVYVENGEVKEGKSYEKDYIKETNDLINKKIQQNDLTLKYDYFRRMER